jgi:hypothetical protein
VNYFPEQPDSLITDFSMPSCDVQIPVKEVVR